MHLSRIRAVCLPNPRPRKQIENPKKIGICAQQAMTRPGEGGKEYGSSDRFIARASIASRIETSGVRREMSKRSCRSSPCGLSLHARNTRTFMRDAPPSILEFFRMDASARDILNSTRWCANHRLDQALYRRGQMSFRITESTSPIDRGDRQNGELLNSGSGDPKNNPASPDPSMGRRRPDQG